MIEWMIIDVIEVIEFFINCLGWDKIIFVGYLWGLVIGVYLVKCWLELVVVFVGIG